MKFLLALLLFAFGLQLNAQEEKVIKKKIKTKKVIKEVKSEEDVSLEVKVKVVNGKEETSYVLKETKDGKTKVTEWNGEGEMPKNIKSYMDNEGLEDSASKEEKVIIIEMNDNGDKKVMKWNSDEEMSEEMKKKLQENDVEFEESGNVTVKKKKIIKHKHDSRFYEVKVRMAIGLDSTPDGVKVAFVDEGGPGDEAGIKEGDVLVMIGDQLIFTDESVYKALSKYNPGDTVNVEVLRNGAKMNLKVKLDSK